MTNRLSGFFILGVLSMISCSRQNEQCISSYKPATASSSYDHNLTAQLLTDGIIETGEPVCLELLTSEGIVDKVEREASLDGDMNSRNIIQGVNGWMEFRPHGYKISAEEAEVLFQEALAGGRGGEKHVVKVPVQINDSTQALRFSLEFPHSGRWRIKNVDFLKNGESYGSALPSEHFFSAWMSAGNENEWVQIDLGSKKSISDVNIIWLNKAERYTVKLSKDGTDWREASRGKGRYVRIEMNGTSNGKPICISEIEVLGYDKTGTVADGWKLCRASDPSLDGPTVSKTGFPDEEWLSATVPGTVLTSFIKAGAVPDPDFGNNAGQISDSYFNSDFWYRKEFEYEKPSGRKIYLEFDGINWKAEVFLNGQKAGEISGAFIRGKMDVTDIINDGRNALAVRIIKNAHPGAVKEKTARWTGYNGGILGTDSPTFLASIGWDWMTTVRGRNCGIWNDVRIVDEGSVSVNDPLVVSKIDESGRATMSVSVKVEGEFNGGSAGIEGWIGDIRFSKEISGPGEVIFSPDDFPQLKDRGMNLWWPNWYGEPFLYDAGFVVKINGSVSDSVTYKAGIREIKYNTDGGSLRLYINGRRLIPMGGNWGFCQQNLDYSAEQYDIAVDYQRQMNFNMVRNWVGQIADEEFYDACDRNGIMIWQDFWLANPADGPDPADEEMFLANAEDYVSRIRRHPSIALYCGRNEGFPPKTLDAPLRKLTDRLHPEIPYISNSADGIVSGHGPYNLEPSEYYFEHQSGKLHSERGIPNVPPIESLRKMMPEECLWPQGDMWGKHDFTEVGAQKGSTYNALMKKAFGEINSAEEYCRLAQWLNYEGYRAIFESAHSAGRMGLLLWMSHSCWPSMVWCPYDYYFEPGGGFFGSKKACEPIHIQYNPVTSKVEVVNLCAGFISGLWAKAEIYGKEGKLISSNYCYVDSENDSVKPCIDIYKPDGEAVFYLSLELSDPNNFVLSDNFYILGAESGNIREVRTLPEAKLRCEQKVDNGRLLVCVRNEDSVPALLVRIILKDSNGNEILPAEYSDNYFSMLPGEERYIEAKWRGKVTGKEKVVITQLCSNEDN